MSDYSELKRLAEAAKSSSGGRWYTSDQLAFRAVDSDESKFVAEATPETVLALIAENEALRDGSNFRAIQSLRQDCDSLREALETVRREPQYSTRLAAERYRWLREQHWDYSSMCVVFNPKTTVKLGTVCPSGIQLDQAIDAERLK